MSLPVPEFERSKTVGLFTIIFYVLLIAAGLWLVYQLRALIPPFLIAIIIALTLAPEIDRMQRRGWKRGLAILVIYALFIAVFAAFLVVLIPFISTQLVLVSQHLNMSDASAHSSHGPLAGITKWVTSFLSAHHLNDVKGPVLAQVGKIPVYLSNYLDYLSVELPLFASQLVWIIIVPILAFYILADYHKILGKTLIFVRPDKRSTTLHVLNDVVAVFGNYVRGVLLMMLLDIVVTYLVLRVTRVQFPETIAVITGILYAIPYLGAVVSTLLIGLVAYQGATIYKALGVLCIMIFIHQFLFDQIIAPRIIGKQVGLHPLWAITAMLIGGTLMGVGGTLIAIPLAAGVQVVLMHLFPRLADDSVAQLSEFYMRESEAKAEQEKVTGVPPSSGKSRGFRRKRNSSASEIPADAPSGSRDA